MKRFSPLFRKCVRYFLCVPFFFPDTIMKVSST